MVFRTETNFHVRNLQTEGESIEILPFQSTLRDWCKKGVFLEGVRDCVPVIPSTCACT